MWPQLLLIEKSKHAELAACEGVGPRIEALNNTVSWVETVGWNSDR